MIPLTMICALCILLLISTNQCTEDQIELNRQRLALRLINEVMPLEYNNNLFTDRIEIAEGNYFSNNVNAYRVRNDGKPVGIVFMPVVGRGYKGRIELVIGLSVEGTVTGVRVNKHQETEGQGDRIDQRKSDWILGFDGRSLANTSTGEILISSVEPPSAHVG